VQLWQARRGGDTATTCSKEDEDEGEEDAAADLQTLLGVEDDGRDDQARHERNRFFERYPVCEHEVVGLDAGARSALRGYHRGSS
jgi:hypothetical protein